MAQVLVPDNERALIRLMKITVILCTYNRCQSLARALNSVAASTLPKDIEWEVLVVDNNSSDQTREVVEEFSRRFPARFRYLLESQPGKSRALNAGVSNAHGDVLAFMDDDVIVDPAWLRNLTAGLEDGEWAGAGGRILPQGGFSPPHWLALNGPYAMGGILAFFDLGDDPGELKHAPFGTNMAFRKTMFEKHGVFRTDLGPSPDPKIPRPNEDTELGRRLMAAGERLRYEPSAVVYHGVPGERLRKKYFLTWWFELGRADARESGAPSNAWHLGIPRTIRGLLPVTLRWLLAVNPQRRLYCKTRIWLAAGRISESYRQRRLTAGN